MSTTDDTTTTNNNTPSVETTTTTEKPVSTWKLPDGIEDHIEAGLIKSAAGIVVGGLVGTLFFKSGKGWRAAGAATGLGVALGSTLERALVADNEKQQK